MLAYSRKNALCGNGAFGMFWCVFVSQTHWTCCITMQVQGDVSLGAGKSESTAPTPQRQAGAPQPQMAFQDIPGHL